MREQTKPSEGARFTPKDIVVGIISTIATLLACGYLVVVLIFNGGVNGLIHNLKRPPDLISPAIITKKDAVAIEIDQSFEELENVLGYKEYATATHDFCSRGSNGYKRSDGYGYRCSLRTTKLYGFNGDFRQEMIDFEQKIIGAGWEFPEHETTSQMQEMLAEYYDNYSVRHSGDIDVSNLPTPAYYKKGDGYISMEIEFAGKNTRSFFSFDYTQKVSGHSLHKFFSEENFQDASIVITEITNIDQFVLAISIQEDYFQN